MSDEHALMAQVTLWVHVPKGLMAGPEDHFYGVEGEARANIENQIQEIVVGGIEDQVRVAHVEVDVQPVHNP